MSDLLSAATLLLTVLGVVYSAWYSDIINAIGIKIPDHAANREPERKIVRGSLYGKALPLAVAASVLALLFLPDAFSIAVGGVRELVTKRCAAFQEYNAVAAAFLVVVILTSALSGYLLFLVCRLHTKLRQINAPSA